MQQILTVTLNPALDVTTSVEAVVAGRKLRCEVPRVEPGGGGVNVSRAISKLGRDSLAFAAVGGAVGAEFRERLENEGVVCKWFDAGGRPGRALLFMTGRQKLNTGSFCLVQSGPKISGRIACLGSVHCWQRKPLQSSAAVSLPAYPSMRIAGSRGFGKPPVAD